ncbi:hypothetical protein MUO14_04370 [Halobacillus shinanisalinarum]|uniref:Alpha/beta hydrolase family protein n=1 Tax=Halobacillus shinanisalinarum TaxID=2932258 RepID=A0ABY4H694_9BACI|nr:hypothetical protein [Halobacillus shinanisalinarum]UOQ95610.1 hypothetical protein MUO14_04370 [Halobacillus shinanisalinarum]
MLYPQYVSKLILESASPGIAHSDEQMARRVKDQGLIDRIASQGIEEFANYWRDIPLFKSQEQLPIEVRVRVQEERLGHDPQGLIQSLKGMGTGRQPSWWDRLSHLSIDTLLIVGEWDEKFVTINKKMKDRLPCSTLVAAEKAGHTVHLERPKFFAKIVEDFVIQ